MTCRRRDLYKVLFLSPILIDEDTGKRYRRGPVLFADSGEQLSVNGDVATNRFVHEVMLELCELDIKPVLRDDGTLEAQILWGSNDE